MGERHAERSTASGCEPVTPRLTLWSYMWCAWFARPPTVHFFFNGKNYESISFSLVKLSYLLTLYPMRSTFLGFVNKGTLKITQDQTKQDYIQDKLDSLL